MQVDVSTQAMVDHERAHCNELPAPFALDRVGQRDCLLHESWHKLEQEVAHAVHQ